MAWTFLTARPGHSCLSTLRQRVEAWRQTAYMLDSDDVIQAAYQQRETLRIERDALRVRVQKLEGFLQQTLKEMEGPWLATVEKRPDGTPRYTLEHLSERLHEISKAGYAQFREDWGWNQR